MPPSVATENYVKDMGAPFVLAQFASNTGTIHTWSPHEWTTPATVVTVASSISPVAREGRQEDGNYPVARRWTLHKGK